MLSGHRSTVVFSSYGLKGSDDECRCVMGGLNSCLGKGCRGKFGRICPKNDVGQGAA